MIIKTNIFKENWVLVSAVIILLLNLGSSAAVDGPPEDIFIVKGMLYIDNDPAEDNITIDFIFSDENNESTTTFTEDNGFNYNLVFKGHVDETATVHIYFEGKDLLPEDNTTITFNNGVDGVTIYKKNFSVDSTSNQQPNIPSDPTPSDEQINVSLNQTLSWEGGDPDENNEVTYTIYLGTSSSSLSLEQENRSTNQYQPDTFAEEKTYYWQITSWDEHGRSNTGPIWQFSTGISNKRPTADAGDSYTGVVGETISFDGTSSNDPDGTITRYEWDFGDGNTGLGQTINHQYGNDDSYTVTLTVTDDDGATDTDTASVSIETGNNDPEKPTIIANDTAFVNEIFTFTVSATDPDGDQVKFGFDWDGDGTIESWSSQVNSGQTLTETHTFTEEQLVLTVQVKTEDENGAQSGFSEHFLSINEKQTSAGESENSGGDFPLIPLIFLIIILVVAALLLYAYKMGALDSVIQQLSKKSFLKFSKKKTQKKSVSSSSLPTPLFQKKENKNKSFNQQSKKAKPTPSSSLDKYKRI